MWDRAVTAVMVVVAAVVFAAAMNNHYALPAELRALEGETRRIKDSLQDLTAKPLPLHDVEANVLLRLSSIDHELARAEADALLLQSKLLEIIAALIPEEQGSVPAKIKDMLVLIDVLSKDAALTLVPELDATHARDRDAMWNVSAGREPALPTSPGEIAATAKVRTHKEAAQQLDELLAEVMAWRNNPGKPPSDEKSKRAGADSREGIALAALRKELNAERKHLQEMSRSTRLKTLEQLTLKVDEPIPETGIPSNGAVIDHSGKHWLIAVTDKSRVDEKVSDMLSTERYAAPSQIEVGDCNKDFGPGLVNLWRESASEWCQPQPSSGPSTFEGKKLARNTKITCRRYQQREHTGADQLCVMENGVVNLAQLSSETATNEVLKKYVDSKHVEDAFVPWQKGTLRGTCKVDATKWKPENFPLWNKALLMSYEQLTAPAPPPPPSPAPLTSAAAAGAVLGEAKVDSKAKGDSKVASPGAVVGPGGEGKRGSAPTTAAATAAPTGADAKNSPASGLEAAAAASAGGPGEGGKAGSSGGGAAGSAASSSAGAGKARRILEVEAAALAEEEELEEEAWRGAARVSGGQRELGVRSVEGEDKVAEGVGGKAGGGEVRFQVGGAGSTERHASARADVSLLTPGEQRVEGGGRTLLGKDKEEWWMGLVCEESIEQTGQSACFHAVML